MTRNLWTDDLLLGHPTLDHEHRQLVDLLNRLANAFDAHLAVPELIAILVLLADRSRTHFTVEEAIMRRIDYPSLESHVAAHRGLTIQLEVLMAVLADGTMEADRHTLDFLVSWLFDHIRCLDRDLAQFDLAWMHTRGLQRAVL